MLGFMVESSRNLLVADYALNKSGTLIQQEAQNWDHLSVCPHLYSLLWTGN